ncbi:hypothetical protein GCM10023190_17830 [Enteractinococcus fodinae]|uniref:DUF2075 family protein n=1 Tax=Enteractinococcus fodinae TaxID=684663 RepID=A0ABU2AWL7_9MICC|nr:DNA/RNA helicase domain-containing protein [Enteractinococcus fodinae]MDR7345745.1 DUF2075 family protein [Enteractinococcus fodinae]
MTSFRIVEHHGYQDLFASLRSGFEIGPIDIANPTRREIDEKLQNWPVVYTLSSTSEIYIGESRNAVTRMRQHHLNNEKKNLDRLHIIVDRTFNKSAALDLEAYLIRLFSGEGQFSVLNRNDGIVDSDYFNREKYQETFDEIFEELRSRGFFSRSIEEIQNLDLYKFSPFKAPSMEQATTGAEIVERFLRDKRLGVQGEEVVQGGAGTGKTVLAVYLLKLLRDIERSDVSEEREADTMFSEFFTAENQELLTGFTAGLVIPQQSLRNSVKKVFQNTPDMGDIEVLSPFDVGEKEGTFDILVVDETHRLNHRANQPSGMQNKRFREINEGLFGEDRDDLTQLDWIREKSHQRILMIDHNQTVRPADIRKQIVDELVTQAQNNNRYFTLKSQMRVKAGSDYPGFIRALLEGRVTEEAPDFGNEYEFGIFSDLGNMRDAIIERDRKFELSRLVAGYAWMWKSKRDRDAFDIEEGGLKLRWNSTDKDWINSKNSLNEVGSIHTVQGYDLNYAGVIIGRDLRMDPHSGEIYFDRTNYFDKKGFENNPRLGITYSDQDILEYVRNIYSVLLSRGIRGTFIYVCDEPLREYFMKYLLHLD